MPLTFTLTNKRNRSRTSQTAQARFSCLNGVQCLLHLLRSLLVVIIAAIYYQNRHRGDCLERIYSKIGIMPFFHNDSPTLRRVVGILRCLKAWVHFFSRFVFCISYMWDFYFIPARSSFYVYWTFRLVPVGFLFSVFNLDRITEKWRLCRRFLWAIGSPGKWRGYSAYFILIDLRSWILRWVVVVRWMTLIKCWLVG